MFGLGGKSNVPQSSQYDFKGTTVINPLILDEATTQFLQAHSLKSRQCRNFRRRRKAKV